MREAVKEKEQLLICFKMGLLPFQRLAGDFTLKTAEKHELIPLKYPQD